MQSLIERSRQGVPARGRLAKRLAAAAACVGFCLAAPLAFTAQAQPAPTRLQSYANRPDTDAQRKAGDQAGEAASLDRAVELEPLSLPAVARRAELHERMGEIPEAVHMWTAAMTVAPPPERRNPALAALLAEKKAMIEAHQRDFAALIDKGLAEARTGLDGADLRRFDRCIDALLGRKRIFHSAPCLL